MTNLRSFIDSKALDKMPEGVDAKFSFVTALSFLHVLFQDERKKVAFREKLI
jgi:hypothetical protein